MKSVSHFYGLGEPPSGTGTSRSWHRIGHLGDAGTHAKRGRVVILDLDGTITFSDTLLPFLWGCFLRFPRLRPGLFLFPLHCLLFLLRCSNATLLKQQLLTTVIGGLPVASVDEWARQFAKRIIASRCRPQMLDLIKRHQQNADRLVVLTASPSIYVRSIAEGLDISEIIATEIEVRDGHYTGRLLSMNCAGIEKLRRIQEYLRLERNEACIVAYGDRKSDIPVLEWADEGWLIRDRKWW